MNDAYYINKAIQSLCPDSEYTFDDADYSTISWIKLDKEPPTKKQIDDEIIKLKQIENEISAKRNAARQALLDRLGITQEEARLLLG